MKPSVWSLVAVCLAVLIPGSLANAGIIFDVTFEDVVNSTGLGFDDPTYGASRRSTFNSTLTYIDSVLNESGAADIFVKQSLFDGTGFLASATPYFWTSPNSFQNGFMFEHITSGADPFPALSDAIIQFDFAYAWNSETDAPAGTEYDLYSVALHEVTHTLGLMSLVGSDGKSTVTSTNPGVFSIYDSFLEKGDGTALFGAGGDFVASTGDLTSGDIWFDGPNAREKRWEPSEDILAQSI